MTRLLPALDRPEYTCGYQGFFHMTSMSGSVESAELHYIIRDHDYDKLTARCEYARRARTSCKAVIPERRSLPRLRRATAICAKDRTGISPCRQRLSRYRSARREADKLAGARRYGRQPSVVHGAACPNLGTGSHNGHSRYEFACAEEMEQCCELILKLAECTRM